MEGVQYINFNCDNLSPLLSDTHDVISKHFFFVFICDNIYVAISDTLTIDRIPNYLLIKFAIVVTH